MDTAQSLPRFRTDLIAQPIDEAGQHFVDVTDPDSGKMFRFYEVEYSIATAMNGQRDIAGLANWADTELGLQPSPDEVKSVIDTLAELGYLDTVPLAPVIDSFDDAFDDDPGLAPAGASPMDAEPMSDPDLGLPELDDLSLGSAGVSGLSTDTEMPAPAELELGLAGGTLGQSRRDGNEEATFVAPSLSLGKAGNEAVREPGGQVTGLGSDHEDDVPTMIKGAEELVGGASNAPSRPSDPGIPPRPPTDLPPEATLQPVGSANDEDDGPTHLPAPATDFDDEMSVDLSEHMQLGPDALKEAVRQSQMIAIPSPEELAKAAAEAERPPKPAPPLPGPSIDELKAKPPTPPPPSIEPTELPSKVASISKPPIAKPSTAFEDESSQPLPGTSSSSSSGRLIALVLVLLLVVAAGLVYMLDLFGIRARLGLEEKNAAPVEQPKPVVKKPVTPPVPKKLKLPSAKLMEGEVVKTDVTSAKKGVLATLIASGTEIEMGDELGTYKGGQAFVSSIKRVTARLDHYQGKLDKAKAKVADAEKAGNAVAAKAAQKDVSRFEKKVAEKQGKIDSDNAKLDEFRIKSSAGGTFETTLESGAKVGEGDVIGTLAGKPILAATFELPKGKKLAKGDEVEVVSKSDDKKRLGCQVTGVEGAKATVECPSDEGLSASDEVVLP